jgi:hypothetical protein
MIKVEEDIDVHEGEEIPMAAICNPDVAEEALTRRRAVRRRFS